jgi:hypothetical protein
MRILPAVSSLILAFSTIPSSHARPAAVSVARGANVLEARIKLAGPRTGGIVSIEEIVSGSPRVLVVEWMDVACGIDATPQLFLNEARLPLAPAEGADGAGCAPRTRAARIVDAAAIAAAWRDGGPNVVRLASDATQAAVAWARVRVGDGLASPFTCLFDAGGGACDSEPSDAAEAARGPFDVGATLPRSGGTVRRLEVPFSGSEVPREIDVSALGDGRHALCVSGGGATTCTEFDHHGEIELRVDEANGDGGGGDSEILAMPTAAIAPGGPPSECTSPSGGAVSLDGGLSRGSIAAYEWFVNFGSAGQRLLGTGPRPSVSLPVGTHTVTLRVTDTRGRTATAQAARTVVDSAPPQLQMTLTPTRLWPAKHQMVPISADAVGSDACGTPALELTAVWSPEPDDAPGEMDGHTVQDVQGAAIGTSDRSFSLRAETGGILGGRRYQVIYTAVDAGGNRTPWHGIVWVRDPALDSPGDTPPPPKEAEITVTP